MEKRVFRFYELHQNKWFHIMNFTPDKKQKYMLMKYGSCFYYD